MTDKKLEYTITHIALKNLSVHWVNAQRPFDKKHAEKIAAEFDPDKFEPIVVTKPNGVGIYHIVEGQHRAKAVEMYLSGPDVSKEDIGNQKVACHVIDHGTPEKAAEIWLGINKGRKASSPVTDFLMGVVAKREEEVDINRIVHKCGFNVSGNRRKENNIAAVGSLRYIYNVWDGNTLRWTLEACRLLWGPDPKGVSSNIIKGIGHFIHEFKLGLDSLHFKKAVLKKYNSPFRLEEAAHSHKERQNDPLPQAMAEVLRRAYNEGRTEDKRLKRKES